MVLAKGPFSGKPKSTNRAGRKARTFLRWVLLWVSAGKVRLFGRNALLFSHIFLCVRAFSPLFGRFLYFVANRRGENLAVSPKSRTFAASFLFEGDISKFFINIANLTNSGAALRDAEPFSVCGTCFLYEHESDESARMAQRSKIFVSIRQIRVRFILFALRFRKPMHVASKSHPTGTTHRTRRVRQGVPDGCDFWVPCVHRWMHPVKGELKA